MASGLSKAPFIDTEASTSNLIEPSSTGVMSKTGARARLTEGSTAFAMKHRTPNRMESLTESEHSEKTYESEKAVTKWVRIQLSDVTGQRVSAATATRCSMPSTSSCNPLACSRSRTLP